MSTITKDGYAVLKKTGDKWKKRKKDRNMSKLKRGLADVKPKADEKQKIAESDLKVRHARRVASKGARGGKKTKRPPTRLKLKPTFTKSRSEFASSIPDESSTIAPIVRGGFQSPPPSPPRTPPSGFSKPFHGRLTPIKLPKAIPPETQHPSATSSEEKDIEMESASDISGAYSDFWHPQDESTDEEDRIYRRQQDMAKRRRRHIAGMGKQHRVVTIPRGGTDVPLFQEIRAKQRKAKKAFKQARVNKRHKIRSHAPFVPKLQINQKGPGHFSVRSTGLTDAVKKQVRSLLSRVKGKLFVNGKFTATKRAYSVIIALLQKKQIIDIQIK